MLTQLKHRGYAIREEPGEYEIQKTDPETDSGPEWERNRTENEVNELT